MVSSPDGPTEPGTGMADAPDDVWALLARLEAELTALTGPTGAARRSTLVRGRSPAPRRPTAYADPRHWAAFVVVGDGG